MTWRKNETTAARRRCILNVAALADGAWADPTTDLTGKVFVRLGDASYVPASGTLTNLRKPLVQADDTFTAASTDIVTLATADPATGSGPFRLTTTGTLPAGIATATDYWWIRTGAKTGKLATTLANALAGTAIDITDAGTGTHTIADTADTEQLVAGKRLYEATQAETDVGVNEVEIAVLDDTYYAQTFVAIEQGDADDIAAVASGMTRDDLLRGIFTMVACKMLGVDAVRAASGNGDVTFYKADGITPSIVITYSSDGRPTVAFLDLTA